MATDTDARSGDVPSTSAARAEADDALAESKRMHFTYARHYVPPSSPTETDQPPSLASLGLTPLVDPRAVPDVLRAVLLEDGCVKVNFRDNTVLRLDATGSAFTVTTPEGETLRQLSEFAVTRFVRKLRSALEFRNKHADVPFLPPAIARLGGGDDDDAASADIDPRFRASARARYASWSLDAEDAERSGFLTRLEGGGAALESTDGIARVVLSAHGLVARVTYPLLFAVKDASDPESAPSDLDAAPSDPADAADAPPRRARRLAHDYVWHTQTFCADACPARWRFPVALLTRAVYGEGASAEKENAEKEDGRNAETAPGTKTTVSETSSRCERAGSVTTLPVSATALPRGVGLSHGLWVDEGDEHEKPWWSSRPRWWGTRTRAADPGARAAPREAAAGRRWSARPARRARGAFAEARSVTPIGTGERPTGPWVEVVSVLDADGDALVSADAAKFVVHVPDEPKARRRRGCTPSTPCPRASRRRGARAPRSRRRARAASSRPARAGRGARKKAGVPTRTTASARARAARAPRALAARVAALRAAAATPASDPEPPSSQTDAVSGVSLGRGATTDSDAAAWAEDPDPWSVLSADIVEESAGDPGSFAAFTAYADGRVRVKFADRTLLELRRDRQAARLLLPDGERVEVRASAPMRWGAYVTAASEFGRWAFLTPEGASAPPRRSGSGTRACARSSMASGGSRRWTRGSFRSHWSHSTRPTRRTKPFRGARRRPLRRRRTAGRERSLPRPPRRGPRRASSCPPRAGAPCARRGAWGGSRCPSRARPWTARASGAGRASRSCGGTGRRMTRKRKNRDRASFAADVRFAGDDGADSERSRRRRSRCGGGGGRRRFRGN